MNNTVKLLCTFGILLIVSGCSSSDNFHVDYRITYGDSGHVLLVVYNNGIANYVEDRYKSSINVTGELDNFEKLKKSIEAADVFKLNSRYPSGIVANVDQPFYDYDFKIGSRSKKIHVSGGSAPDELKVVNKELFKAITYLLL